MRNLIYHHEKCCLDHYIMVYSFLIIWSDLYYSFINACSFTYLLIYEFHIYDRCLIYRYLEIFNSEFSTNLKKIICLIYNYNIYFRNIYQYSILQSISLCRVLQSTVPLAFIQIYTEI